MGADPAETVRPPADEADSAQQAAKAWTEVFTLFQQSGHDDRGAAYAMSMGSLRRKGEELEEQIEALAHSEEQLLKHARSEAEARVPAPRDAAAGSNNSRVLGLSRASALTEKLRDVTMRAAASQEPWQAAVLADEAHREAVEALEKQQQEQAEAEARAKAEEEAQAKVAAEAAATRAKELSEAEKAALRAQGLNSRRLPMRPGLPPCGLWDHPEPETNSLGHPLRPGQPVCALFRRTHTCKFGTLCVYDHPEVAGQEIQDQPGALPLALVKVAAQQHQLQLQLHLQLMQELPSLQDPEAMMNAWVRFRVTFSLNV